MVIFLVPYDFTHNNTIVKKNTIKIKRVLLQNNFRMFIKTNTKRLAINGYKTKKYLMACFASNGEIFTIVKK